ncbi:hypothetical protein D9619_003910 [Psilocybe cf. subviscida]|uniref:DUF5648 domain-containing protein n=1 Tax=Psilocybe cf. subviscida TaxID=2480587 RepID=A0A8H5F8C6_9AGAR|nr:hypothetical protein D9619_003910 [Psilocybe cf. subviscida]
MKMTRSLNLVMMLILPTFLGMGSLATPVTNSLGDPAIRVVGDVSPRSANTCADPSLARTVFQGFAGSILAHVLHFHYAFVNSDSKQSTGPALWTFQGPVGKAWPTQQAFTMPLFRLTNPTNSDFIFMVGADAQTPPTVKGFSATAVDLVAWVYDTAVCDSVPLMSAVLAAQSDHYYTTDPDEHAALLAAGDWTDGGVVAFVLPLPTL